MTFRYGNILNALLLRKNNDWTGRWKQILWKSKHLNFEKGNVLLAARQWRIKFLLRDYRMFQLISCKSSQKLKEKWNGMITKTHFICITSNKISRIHILAFLTDAILKTFVLYFILSFQIKNLSWSRKMK